MKNWMKLVIAGILIPVFLYFWPSALGGDTEFLIVRGNSMLPTIEPGSLVITKEGSPYEIGEIVSFPLVQEGRVTIVVHRIIAEEERGFTIQGDNNEKPDRGFFTEEDVKGRVIFATPIIGNLLEMARNPIFLIITALTIVVVQMAQKSRKQKREKLRRIRLGLPKPSPNLNDQSKINQKKPD